MEINKAVLDFGGTTGLRVEKYLVEKVTSELGEWPPFLQRVAAETTRHPAPPQPSRRFTPIGVDLSRLFPERYALTSMPAYFKELPQEFWTDTSQGGGKSGITAALAAMVHAATLKAARDAAIEDLSSHTTLSQILRLQQRRPDVAISSEEPLAILTIAARGSTGQAVAVTGALDDYTVHMSGPTLIFLVDPRGGGSADDHRHEDALFSRCLLSLQYRCEKSSRRLWAFRMNGPDFETTCRETASFIWDLLRDGTSLRRRLFDGFRVSSSTGLSEEMARFLCNVDVNRQETQPEHIRRRRALEAISNSMIKEV